MGRKKIPIKELDSSMARQKAYARRKKGIIKKAHELSVLCDSNVGVIMFSPTGKLSSFSGHESLEDIFIRFLREPDQTRGVAIEDREKLIDSLMHLKYEAQIMELLAEKEDLEAEYKALRQKHTMVQETMRFYIPGLDDDASMDQVQASEKSITEALQHVKQLKEKLFGDLISNQGAVATKIPEGEIADASRIIKELLESNPIVPGDQPKKGHESDQPKKGHLQETGSSSMGPNLGISSISEGNNWNLPGSKLPFKEIVGHELINTSPDEQQNMDGGSSDVTNGGPTDKPDSYDLELQVPLGLQTLRE